MNKPTEMLLSRNYVEFGPFTSEELSAFATRGLLLESDYVKETSSHAWQPCMTWLSSLNGTGHETTVKTPEKKRTVKPKASK